MNPTSRLITASTFTALTIAATLNLTSLVRAQDNAPAPALASAAETKQPAVFAYDPAILAATRARILANDPAVQPAFKLLIRDADKALNMKPVSVMDKEKSAPGTDKHDYFSLAPYWWPDATKADGLPYIRHDGKINPTSKDGNDAKVYPKLCNTVELLGLAYYFTGNEVYAQKAAQLTAVWFIDPATRMNPNLAHAQGIPGRNDGRGAGVLEGRHICALTDGLALISTSPAWPAKAQTAMRAWLEAYYQWLTTSKNGTDEVRAPNNHGSWYAVQAAHLELVLGKPDAARARIEKQLTARIASQIEPSGRQPKELERTKSYDYSLFNLEALFALTQLGDRVGYSQGWTYATKSGSSLHAALAYVAPYIDPAKKWPDAQIAESNLHRVSPLLRTYLARQNDADLRALYDKFALTQDQSAERWHLLLPPLK